MYNDAGVGGRRHDGQVRLTDLFERFQAHYGFGYAFRNPYSDHEKGAVEAEVGTVGRGLFVPRPGIRNLAGFNGRPLERRLWLGGKPHCRKGGDETAVFHADRAALRPLPGKEFDVVRPERMRTDEYGVVAIDGGHRYAADPADTGHEVIVAFRAFGVEILETSGSRPAVHAGTRGGGTSQDSYDSTNAKPPEGHAEERPLGPDFTDKTHGLVLHGRTGRGKSHLAIAPGTQAVEHGMNARFHQTAEPAPRPGRAKRDGTLDAKSKDPARADPITPRASSATHLCASTGPGRSTGSSPVHTREAASSSPPTSNPPAPADAPAKPPRPTTTTKNLT